MIGVPLEFSGLDFVCVCIIACCVQKYDEELCFAIATLL